MIMEDYRIEELKIPGASDVDTSYGQRKENFLNFIRMFSYVFIHIK